MSKGYLYYTDRLNQKMVGHLDLDPAAGDLAAVQALADGIQPYINPAITRCEFVAITTQAITKVTNSPFNLPYPSGTEKLVCIFNYIEDGTKKVINLSIPAPNMEALEEVQGQGYRLSSVGGDGIATALNTLLGRSDITFLRGFVKSSRSKR